MRNRFFFAQEALDLWMADDKVDVSGDEITLKAEGRRYRTIESVRIVREISGTPDPHDLVGKVKSRAFLSELGAELLEGSMIIGDNAYDVVPGFVGSPIGTFDDFRRETSSSADSEERLIAAFLAGAC